MFPNNVFDAIKDHLASKSREKQMCAMPSFLSSFKPTICFFIALEPNGIGYYAKAMTWHKVIDFSTLIDVINVSSGEGKWYFIVKQTQKITKEGFSVVEFNVSFDDEKSIDMLKGMLMLADESTASDNILLDKELLDSMKKEAVT